MVDFLVSILYGIVEGITEWLPISSTGHLIILENFLKMNISQEFFSIFLVVIQLGAIFAVLVLFWDKINPFRVDSKSSKIIISREKINLWQKVLVGVFPAAIIGILFDDISEALFYNYFSVSAALIVFALFFFYVESKAKHLKGGNPESRETSSLSSISYKQAIGVGFFQILAAIFPGTSRSGATISGGMLLGLDRVVAAEFTFIMAIPVMFGASILRLAKYGFSHTMNEWLILIIGMISAFVCSVLVIKYLLSYLRKHSMVVFGIYRIILGVLLIGYGLLVS